MEFNSFPKIRTLGQRNIASIFDTEVEVTEKIDGSQFAFVLTEQGLRYRSKGRVFEHPDKLFELAVAQVQRVEHIMQPNIVFYGEYLNKPKHNVLAYNKTPKNNLCLFGATNYYDGSMISMEQLREYAFYMEFDVVPVLFQGKVNSADELNLLMDQESYLGGPKMEGVVVKNYSKPFLIGTQYIPLMCGKYVSEAFKEVHNSTWTKEHTSRGTWNEFVEGYRTEARWNKSVQHLREAGLITDSPKDIGPLIKEVHRDITEEEKETIKDALWTFFGKDLVRLSTHGLPEWYKQQLLEKAFDEGFDREPLEQLLS